MPNSVDTNQTEPGSDPAITPHTGQTNDPTAKGNPASADPASPRDQSTSAIPADDSDVKTTTPRSSTLAQDQTTAKTQIAEPQTGPTPKQSEMEWWVPIPWLISVATLILGYKLGQWATRTNNVVTLTLNDITAFRTQIESYISLVKMHQRGTPIEGTFSLDKSREKLTKLRKDAASVQRQIQDALKTNHHQNEWKASYFDWKQATEGDPGLITKKTQAWSNDAILRLEEASDSYLRLINRYRRQIASHKVALAA